jgi:hypothetical protein
LKGWAYSRFWRIDQPPRPPGTPSSFFSLQRKALDSGGLSICVEVDQEPRMKLASVAWLARQWMSQSQRMTALGLGGSLGRDFAKIREEQKTGALRRPFH